MKFVVLAFTFAAAISAQADQAGTMTCKGKNVVLTEKSPYLGENSQFAQSLYVLQADAADDSKNTAYFLDIDYDIGKGGVLEFRGRNNVGGNFELSIDSWEDEGDGTVIRKTSKGLITYTHGPLRGTDEAVSCILE
jgi:hypothetical protein